MSCDGNRAAFFTAMSGVGSAAAQAFGGPAEAVQALDTLYALGRNGPKPPRDAKLAEAQTRLLFAQMQRGGLKPPTHSASGLPRSDAQYGYALIQQTLQALARGDALPAATRDLLRQQARQRQISGVRADATGRVRCSSCGRFASAARGHVCPRTATPDALRRSLARRMGMPPETYSDTELEPLLDEARTGDVPMRHPVTGEIVNVTLDGLPLALGSGFVPLRWEGRGRPIVTATGTVFTVIDGGKLTPAPDVLDLPARLAAKRDAVRAELQRALDSDEKQGLFSHLRDLEDAVSAAPVLGAAQQYGLDATEIPILSDATLGLETPTTHHPTPDARRPTPESVAYGSDPNRAYRVRYRVVDLDDLVPSNLDSGAINPAYDARLQPRQRDRAASQTQIASVAQKLTPDALLTDFKQLDKGAPIIGDDRNVESGNGRVLALRKARALFPDQWNTYQGRLRDVATGFGIDQATLDGMRAPVLVRERLDDVDRAAFAREANAPPVLQMSTLENAVVDARRLSDATLQLLQVREDQSIDLALRARSNQAFVRAFAQTLPENERAVLMRADGSLNQQGIWRIKAALFTRVFPGNAGRRLAETFIEALDSTTRNFEQAVAGCLPALIRAQRRLSSGERVASLDLSGDMAVALDMLARLREQELPVGVYLEQSQLFERELTPFQETVLRHFDNVGRSPKAIRGFLSAYAQAIEDAPDPNQNTLFDGTALTKEQLFFRCAGGTIGEATDALAA